jgi:thioredoxin 1
MSNKSLIKILALIVAVLIIAGIWVIKNNSGDYELETEAIDLAELKSHGLPIIIDFGSDSCEPCKKMAPVLQKANEEMKGKAIIKFVDVWKYPDGADGFPIQVIPTQVFLNADGTPYVPNSELGIEFIQYSSRETGEHIFTVHQGGLTEVQMNMILADMGAMNE